MATAHLTFPRRDITGKRFGKLVVVAYAGVRFMYGRKRQMALCRCECGKEKIIPRDLLHLSKSCGCGKPQPPFWEKLIPNVKILPNGCWEWQGACRADGYGTIMHHGRTWRLHRIIYLARYGHIPKGKFICHHCDNPRCCNPAHLFPGTARDNNLDSKTKGHLRGKAVTKAKHALSNSLPRPSGGDGGDARRSLLNRVRQ